MNACEWRVTTPVIVIHFLIYPCHFNDCDHESAYGSSSWDVIKSWVRVTSFSFVVFLSSLAISRIHYSMVHSRCLSIAIPLSLTPHSFASSQHSSNIHTITFFSNLLEMSCFCFNYFPLLAALVFRLSNQKTVANYLWAQSGILFLAIMYYF